MGSEKVRFSKQNVQLRLIDMAELVIWLIPR